MYNAIKIYGLGLYAKFSIKNKEATMVHVYAIVLKVNTY